MTAQRESEVLAALATVNDPELDESIVALGFIDRLAVEANRVEVAFRLPTYWCAANFAWIMAEDMRSALRRLPWVREAEIRLVDHFAAVTINEGVAGNKGFRETFGAEASGDLAELRATFRRKAFLGRMSALIETLGERGWSNSEVVAVTVARLQELAAEPDLGPLVSRYLELRAFFGGPCNPSNSAFRTAEGELLSIVRLPTYIREIRLTRRSVEANGEMCRILLKERYAPSSSPPEGVALAQP